MPLLAFCSLETSAGRHGGTPGGLARGNPVAWLYQDSMGEQQPWVGSFFFVVFYIMAHKTAGFFSNGLNSRCYGFLLFLGAENPE